MVEVLPRSSDASIEAGVRVLIGTMVLVDTASASESRVKNKHHAVLITVHLSKYFKSAVGGGGRGRGRLEGVQTNLPSRTKNYTMHKLYCNSL